MATCDMTFEYHPIAGIFPLMDGEAFEAFKADVAENGLLTPIWTHEGRIIDGRNRYRACRELGIEPEICEWSGVGSLVAFVVSLNLHRRHLDSSQRAMIAARIKPEFEAEAKARQGTRTDLRANLPEGEFGRARDQAAEAVNVSSRLVGSATKVLESGDPRLIRMVVEGEVSVSAAAVVADLSDPFRAAVVGMGPEAVKRCGRPDPAAFEFVQAGEDSCPRDERPDPSREISREIIGGCDPGAWPDGPDREPTPRPRPEPDAEFRWLKFWDGLSVFLVSLPRRGGIVNLTRHWSPEKVDAAIVRLRDLVDAASKCIAELEEVRP